MAVGSVRDFGTQKGRRALLSDAMVAVASHHHSSVAENRRTKSGFSFANGDCVTHITPAFIGAADVGDAPAKPMRWPSEPPQQSFALSTLVVGLPVRGASWIGVCKFDYSS
jgi:hypothetical protein